MQFRNAGARIFNRKAGWRVLRCNGIEVRGELNPRPGMVSVRTKLRSVSAYPVLIGADVKAEMVFRQRGQRRRRTMEAEKSTGGSLSRLADPERVARACFNFDKLTPVKELLALRQVLMDKAVSIEMVAAERVFDSALSERLAGQARLLRKVASELEP